MGNLTAAVRGAGQLQGAQDCQSGRGGQQLVLLAGRGAYVSALICQMRQSLQAGQRRWHLSQHKHPSVGILWCMRQRPQGEPRRHVGRSACDGIQIVVRAPQLATVLVTTVKVVTLCYEPMIPQVYTWLRVASSDSLTLSACSPVSAARAPPSKCCWKSTSMLSSRSAPLRPLWPPCAPTLCNGIRVHAGDRWC